MHLTSISQLHEETPKSACGKWFVCKKGHLEFCLGEVVCSSCTTKCWVSLLPHSLLSFWAKRLKRPEKERTQILSILEVLGGLLFIIKKKLVLTTYGQEEPNRSYNRKSGIEEKKDIFHAWNFAFILLRNEVSELHLLRGLQLATELSYRKDTAEVILISSKKGLDQLSIFSEFKFYTIGFLNSIYISLYQSQKQNSKKFIKICSKISILRYYCYNCIFNRKKNTQCKGFIWGSS